MKSLKFRFRLIIYLFVGFFSLFLAELFYFNYLERKQDSHIQESTRLLRDLAEYSQAEHSFIESLEAYAKEDVLWTESSSGELIESFQKLKTLKGTLEGKLAEWREVTRGTDEAIEGSFAKLSEKRFLSYQKALDLLKQSKRGDLEFLLKVEKKFAQEEPAMVLKILDGSREQSMYYQKMYSWLFFFSLMFFIPAFILILIVSTGILNTFLRDINLLVNVADEIREGDFEKHKVRAKLKETERLVEAFEAMQAELINRDRLLQIESDKVRDFNKSLEAKVEERNKQIQRKNEMLERKNEELEQILYAASHDLRTPLVGIQGFSQELQYLCDTLQNEIAELEVDDDVAERLNVMLSNEVPDALKFIMNGSSKMESMIQGLLKVSRLGLQALDLERVEMTKVFSAVNDQLSFQAQTAGALILAEQLEPCMGDKEQLEQVFLNLISNAIKYKADDRSCEVKMSSELSEDGQYVTYQVKDNGIGISEEQVNSVFKTFYRVDPDKIEGEGLGLTIANRIIDKHGGKMWVESKLGEGSSFFVQLPTTSEGGTSE